MPESRTSKVIFYFIWLLLVWVLLEVAAYAGIGILDDKRFSARYYQEKRDQVIVDYQKETRNEHIRNKKSLRQEKVVRRSEIKEILHPYIGYVKEHRDYTCPSFGFCDDRARHQKAEPSNDSDKNLIIGVFGGSFANGVSSNSTPGRWEKRLAEIPEFRDRNILIQSYSMGGYKQPQQLMALNYFLTLGVKFDYVINIDGFNEIVLPIVDGLSFGTHPIFPRSWARRLRGSYNKDMLVMAGTVEYYKKKRLDMARSLNQSAWRFSPLVNLAWKITDDRRALKVNNLHSRLVSYVTEEKFRATFAATGPDYEPPEGEEIYKDLAQIWARSSEQMAKLSSANGIRYFHFLQPNQYVKDSKPMSEEEQKIALMDEHPYRPHATAGYPQLIKTGKTMTENGVPYHDLTPMFTNNPEVLYFDACCHLNQQGYDLVIDHIVEVIRSNLQ